MCMYVCTYLAPYYLSKISFDCQGVYAGNNNGLSLYYLIHTLPIIYFRQVIGYQRCTHIHMYVCLFMYMCVFVYACAHASHLYIAPPPLNTYNIDNKSMIWLPLMGSHHFYICLYPSLPQIPTPFQLKYFDMATSQVTSATLEKNKVLVTPFHMILPPEKEFINSI